MKIYTIGHSNHKWETFLSLLKAHGIQTLVDVRTKPVSRYARFANKHKMPELLNQEGIEYVFMGDTLGGKPDDPTLYDNKGKPDYRAMASKLDFLDGIDSLINLAENNTLVVMCSEGDPSKCHRKLLIEPVLKRKRIEVSDIVG